MYDSPTFSLALLLFVALILAPVLFAAAPEFFTQPCSAGEQLPPQYDARASSSFGNFADVNAEGSFGNQIDGMATSSFGHSARAPPAAHTWPTRHGFVR